MFTGLTRRDFVKRAAMGASAAVIPAIACGAQANERIRLGWVGMGNRGEQLLTQVLKNFIREVRTVAVCDLLDNRVAKGVQLAGFDRPKGYADMRIMIEQERLDAVIVATPPATHAEVSIPVMQAGIHCLQEAPLETTVEKIDSLTRVARKAAVVFQIGAQRRYNPGFAAALPRLLKGEFGEVTFMQGHWHWPWALLTHPIETTGGMFLDQACHHFDVMCWVMNEKPPSTCTAMGYHQSHPKAGPRTFSPTHATASFRFPSGQLLAYTHLFCLPKRFTDEQLQVFCENGCLDLIHGMFYDADNTEKRVGEDTGSDSMNGTTEMLGDFFDSIRNGGGRAPRANLETARNAALMGIMGRMAMSSPSGDAYEPRVIRWADLKTTTELETKPASVATGNG